MTKPQNKTATFALGCFWSPQYYFGKLGGVVNTEVGYAGVTTSNPTYNTIGDHTETVQIEYDPDKISYEELLDHFWMQHNPTYPNKTQYKSIIFYHDDEQKELAEKSLKEEQQEYDEEILTVIKPAENFYKAEDYHQDFICKRRGEL